MRDHLDGSLLKSARLFSIHDNASRSVLMPGEAKRAGMSNGPLAVQGLSALAGAR